MFRNGEKRSFEAFTKIHKSYLVSVLLADKQSTTTVLEISYKSQQMIRRRGEGPLEEEESSSDDDDAFSALSKKVDVRSFVTNTCTIKPEFIPKVALLPVSKTSSMKRHHKPDDARKASMDALIQELEAENSNQKPKKMNRFVPEKKGSFVQPDEEHLTTNLFIGNLAPSITEEDLSNLFSQFGEKVYMLSRSSDDLFYLCCLHCTM